MEQMLSHITLTELLSCWIYPIAYSSRCSNSKKPTVTPTSLLLHVYVLHCNRSPRCVEKICNDVFQGCREVKMKAVIDFDLTRAAPNGGYCYPVITGHIQTLNKLPVLVYV